MQSDSAYLAQCPKMVSLLLEASDGKAYAIPQHYLDNFHHLFVDGDISLVPAISKFDCGEFLEDFQVEEVIESLTKVNPTHWPDYDSIESVNLDLMYCDNDGTEDALLFSYVEDNLGTSEKVQRVLKAVIESVFKSEVVSIRDRAGNFPSPKNNFLQEKDGTFSGIFKHENFSFYFEIVPTESGWICTYRTTEGTLDSVKPPKKAKRAV